MNGPRKCGKDPPADEGRPKPPPVGFHTTIHGSPHFTLDHPVLAEPHWHNKLRTVLVNVSHILTVAIK